MSRSNKKPVQIIDHEPLNFSPSGPQSGSSAFGRRKITGTFDHQTTISPEDANDQPFEPSGISRYFIRQVKERQASRSGKQINRSAIRNISPLGGNVVEDSPVPYLPLAGVVALAFAIPFGFVFITENFKPSTLGSVDPITTASVSRDGVVVQDVSMTRILKNGTFVVTINGKVSNGKGKSRTLLPLIVSLHDKEGKEVQSWRHRLGKPFLKQDGTIRFMTSAIDHSGKAETARVVAKTVH